MRQKYTINQIRKVLKPLDSWWTVLVIDPIAIRVTWLVSNYTRLSPNTITLIMFLISLISAFFFSIGTYTTLIIGAILYEFSFVLDCVDGKLARLTKTTSAFGTYFDLALDDLRIVINLIALSYGQYIQSGDFKIWIFAILFMYLHSFYDIQGLLKYKLLKGVPLEKNVKAEIECRNTMISKLKTIQSKLAKRRLMLAYTTIDQEALVFFIFPIFNRVLWGFILANILMTIWLMLDAIYFYKIRLDQK